MCSLIKFRESDSEKKKKGKKKDSWLLSLVSRSSSTDDSTDGLEFQGKHQPKSSVSDDLGIKI